MAYQGTGVEPCKYPGCARARYIERTSSGRNVRVHDFCGRTHAELYLRWMSNSLPAPTRRSWTTSTRATTTTAGARQPMKATQDYRLQTTVAGGANKDSRGGSQAGTRHTGLTRSNSLPRNYRPRGLASHSSIQGTNEILFYNRYDPYYEFTNFYYAPVKIDGKMWPTTEHYFQAQKFIGTPYVEKIRNFSAPREAFQYSRSPAVHRWQRSDWEEVKEDVMLKALHCKFDQHANLLKMLLETRGKRLVEHTSNDSYWGDGGDGSGRNRLGELLMKVRREIQEQHGSPPPPSSSSFRHLPGASSGGRDSPSESSHRLRTSRQQSTSMSRLTDIPSESHPGTSHSKKIGSVSKPGPRQGLTASQPKPGPQPSASKRPPSLRRRSASMSDLSRPQGSLAHTGTDWRNKHSLQPRPPITPAAYTRSPITHV